MKKLRVMCIPVVIFLVASILSPLSYESNTVETRQSSVSCEFKTVNDYRGLQKIEPVNYEIKITVTPIPINKKVATPKPKENIEKVPIYNFTDKEIEILERITEAECTGQSIESKKNVCSVVINRVNNKEFPDAVKDVVFEKTDGKQQFSPVSDNRYYEVEITDETKQAVSEVLYDGCTNEATYFFNMNDVKSGKIKRWIDKKLSFLIKDDSGHSFYAIKE